MVLLHSRYSGPAIRQNRSGKRLANRPVPDSRCRVPSAIKEYGAHVALQTLVRLPHILRRNHSNQLAIEETGNSEGQRNMKYWTLFILRMASRVALAAVVVIWLVGQRGPAQAQANLGPATFGFDTSYRDVAFAVYPSLSMSSPRATRFGMRELNQPWIDLPGIVLRVSSSAAVVETKHAITVILLTCITLVASQLPTRPRDQCRESRLGPVLENES